MTTIRYWDIDPSERAALSEADVARLCDVELMVEGVVAPKLHLLPEEPVALPATEIFVIEVPEKWGNKRRLDVAFATIGEAAAFLAGKVLLRKHEYGAEEHFAPMLDAAVVPCKLPDESTLAAHKAALDRCHTAKTQNDKARETYKKQVEAANKVVDGIWQNYRDEVRLQARIDEVRATYATYIAMANGDRDAAGKFLRKSFPPEYWECRGTHIDLAALVTQTTERTPVAP